MGLRQGRDGRQVGACANVQGHTQPDSQEWFFRSIKGGAEDSFIHPVSEALPSWER